VERVVVIPVGLGEKIQVLIDIDGDLDLFAEPDWYDHHALHEAYTAEFGSCSPAEWRQWVLSGRSGMLTFLPFEQQQRMFYVEGRFLAFLQERGVPPPGEFPYRS